MSLWFGKKKSEKEKIITLLDVENASVGVALVRLPTEAQAVLGQAPQLLVQKRIALPVAHTLDAARLVHETEKAVHEVLVYARASATEEVSPVAAFLGAPWSAPSWARPIQNQVVDPLWEFEPYVHKSIMHLVQGAPISFYAFGSAAMHAADTAFEHDQAFILCVVTGEVCEILCIQNNTIVARATLPFGVHTLSRTLSSHAGVSLSAARSALHLVDTSSAHKHAGPSWIHEPLSVAATHFATHFTEAARELHIDALSGEPAHSVLVVAPEPLGELFASILGNNAERLSKLFPNGGVVRALRAHHLVPHFSSAGVAVPDLRLMTEALFINKHTRT